MTELTENVQEARPPKGVVSDLTKVDGSTPGVVIKEAVEGEKILKRLMAVVEAKFQAATRVEYDVNANERERAFESGYRKALKDVYRLLQFDN
jgi:hypothetical protein